MPENTRDTSARLLTSGWTRGGALEDQGAVDRYRTAISDGVTLTSAEWSNGASVDLVRYTDPDDATTRFLVWETSASDEDTSEWLDYLDEAAARTEWEARVQGAEQEAQSEGSTRNR